jgi:hypothetical protein
LLSNYKTFERCQNRTATKKKIVKHFRLSAPAAYCPNPSIIIRQNAQPPAYTQDANYKKPALSSNYKIFEKYQNRTATKKQIIILPSSATALPTAQNRW